MINGVSFGAISTDPTIKLQDTTISQQQGNAQPTAATDVKPDAYVPEEPKEKKKHTGLKVILGGIAAIGAAAVALTQLAKHGKLPAAATKKVNDATNFAQKKLKALKDVKLPVFCDMVKDFFNGIPQKLDIAATGKAKSFADIKGTKGIMAKASAVFGNAKLYISKGLNSVVSKIVKPAAEEVAKSV